MTAICAKCGADRAEITVTLIATDTDVPVHGDVFSINPTCIEQPDAIDVEALCPDCGHARYLNDHDWEWA